MTLSRYPAAAACSRAWIVSSSRFGKFAKMVFCFSVATIRALAASATAFYEVARTYEVAPNSRGWCELMGLFRRAAVV